MGTTTKVQTRTGIGVTAIALTLAGCASGPSSAAVALDRAPASTTTTEAPPEGVAVVRISNGTFRPANLKLDLDQAWIVEWRHEDEPEREYVITAREGEFVSDVLSASDTFQIDFSQFDPGIYRYSADLGAARVPGSVDTRPDQ